MTNKEKIQNVIQSLYDYQQDALRAILENKKGKIKMPTGTGKTRVEAATIAIDILKSQRFKMYSINAPRIMLSYQLLREVYSFLVKFGVEARYMCVHSGGATDIKELEEIRNLANESSEGNIPYSEIANGTSTETIKDMLRKAENQNLPLIFFSTYHSADRIELALQDEKKLEIIINDESQYLTQGRFFELLKTLKPKRLYSFTATEIHSESDEGRGMNNEKFYGKSLYSMTPMEAITKGKMVRPRMQWIVLKDKTQDFNKDEFDNSLPYLIEESFYQHQYANRGIEPKILISVSGTKDMVRFKKSKEYTSLRNNNVSIYMVSSNESIGNLVNDENVSRQEFLKRLKTEGEDLTKKIIVLHFDILAEGIDVSGFSGWMPLRHLSDTKTFQSYGRVARLDPRDRKGVEDGTLDPKNLDGFIKKYAWVIIPTIIHENLDAKEHIGELIHKLRDFGFNPVDDMVITNDANGLPTIDGLEALNSLKKRFPNIGKNIEEVEAEYEDEKLASLETEEEIVDFIGGLFSKVGKLFK